MSETRSSHHVPTFLRRGLRRSKARGRSPSPEKVNDFLRERVGSFRAVPPGASQYDAVEERYKDQDAIALEDLKMIIDAHDEDPSTQLKVTDSSWSTVFAQIAAAKQKHQKKKGISVNADSVDVISECLNLIPEELGLGVLKSGLSLILDAAVRHDENRQKILDTFETLPDTIITINTAHNLLEPDADDEERRMGFLSMLIKDIPALVKILLGTEPWYRKLAGFLLLSIPESSTVEGILSRWTQQVTILQEHVRKLQIQSQAKALAELDRLHGIETSVKSIEQAVNAPEGGIRALLAENGPLQQIVYETVKKAVSEIPEGLPDYVRTTIFADVATIVREDAKSRLRDKRLEEDDLERKRKRLYREKETFLREREEWLRGQEEYITRERLSINNQVTPHRRRSGAHRQPTIKPIHLLGVLGVSMDDAWQDLNVALRESGSFEAHAQDWARRLLATPVFRTWLEGDRSSVLLAEGHLDPQRVSPLSGFCCALVSGLIEDRDAAVAFFFAGLRVEVDQDQEEEEEEGGGGAPPAAAVLRHLIAQMLLNANLPEPDLGFMNLQMLEDCRRGDFYTLCDVFAAVVQQVPPDMRVFCVVDGIASCEQEPWLAEFRYMAALLEDLAKSTRPGREGGLKVLLTTPTWSPTVAELAMRPGSTWLRASLASGDADPGVDTEEDD